MVSRECKEFYQKIFESRKEKAGSIHDMRRDFEKFLESFAPPGDISFQEVKIGNVKGEWTLAPQCRKDKVIIYLHGGGFNLGTVRSHRDLSGRLSRSSGFAVLAVEYRLAPEFPFPAGLQDCVEAYTWLLSQGIPSQNIMIAGSSAGGGLAMSTLLLLRNKRIALPAAAILLCPWVDLSLKNRSHKTNAAKDTITAARLKRAVEMYIGRFDPEDPLISPLQCDLSGLPPLLIQVGSWEILLDDAVLLSEKAKKAGVPAQLEVWDEMFHNWHLFAQALPEGRDAIEHIASYLKQIEGHYLRAA